MSNQLIKKDYSEGYRKVFPKTFIDAIKDRETGMTLAEILQGFNMYFLSYNGNKAETRNQVPPLLRKEGLWITYVLYDHTVVSEWYDNSKTDDDSWGSDENWRIASNALVGDISVSADGYWVINGIKSSSKAQGERGTTPLLRIYDNKLQVSYTDGKTYDYINDTPVYTKFKIEDNKLHMSTDLGNTWETISDYIAAQFRWVQEGTSNNVGKIQISRDEGKTWSNLTNSFSNNLHISRYIGANESLPTTGVSEGTIYMKGPYYDENDTNNDYPIYRMWVYAWKNNTLAWQDNGEFQSVVAGVVQERGDSELNVMSQAAVTRELTELESEVAENETLTMSNGGDVIAVFLSKSESHTGIDSNGKNVHISYSFLSPYIKVIPQNSYKYRLRVAKGNSIIAFYDKDKNLISTIASDDSFQEGKGVVPNNAVYMRLCTYDWDNPTAYNLYFRIGVQSQLDDYLQNSKDAIKGDNIQDGAISETKLAPKVITNAKLSDELQNAIYSTDVKFGIFETAARYVGNVGDAASKESASDYLCASISVNEGDVLTIKAQSGSSAYTILYIKEGKVVNTPSSFGTLVDETIVCDNTFDHILVNSYVYRIDKPMAKKTSLISTSQKTIKILCFGNSFTEDSMGYVPAIIKNIAPNVNLTIGIAFISGSPLTQHCAYLTNTTRTDRFNTYSVDGGKYYKDGNVVSYTYIKSNSAINSGKWSIVDGKSVDEMLTDDEWDIITFQQAGTPSDGSWEEWYEPYIYDLQKALFTRMSRNIKIGWLLVHGAYESTNDGFLSHWRGSAENSEKVMNRTATSVLFPYGTAVQNLRTTPLIELGNGSAHNLTYDNAHLQEGIGCLAAAYTNALVLLKELGQDKIGIIGDTFRPSVDIIESYAIPSPHWVVNGEKQVIGISDGNVFLAQVSAEKAIYNPYNVTDLSAFVA